MRFEENEEVIVDIKSLNDTFMHPEVKDRKIVAISIIGAFRKGKSFLMDYALRYMYANVSMEILSFCIFIFIFEINHYSTNQSHTKTIHFQINVIGLEIQMSL